jgi:GNAT superfamily N-acetyltransferase
VFLLVWAEVPDAILAFAEDKLVQIIALPEMRRRGIATMLITQSCPETCEQGSANVCAHLVFQHAVYQGVWAGAKLIYESPWF